MLLFANSDSSSGVVFLQPACKMELASRTIMSSSLYMTLMAFGVLPVGIVVAIVAVVAFTVVVAECCEKRLNNSELTAVK